MKLLEERIRKDGTVKAGNVLKVDSFLNHQMDIDLFNEMGKEWARLFAGCPITNVHLVIQKGIGLSHHQNSDSGGVRYRYCLCGSAAFSCARGFCQENTVAEY